MTRFVSNIEDFEELIALGSKEVLLLSGDLVYITHDKETIDKLQLETDDRYVLQAPRLASRGGRLNSVKQYLYIAVLKNACDLAKSYRGKVYLAADQYLAYGLSQKKNCVVVGGGLNNLADDDMHNLNLEFFVFTDGILEKTLERNTASAGYLLELTLKGVFSDSPNHVVLWCEPLGEPPIFELQNPDLFEVVGSAPIKQLIKRELVTRNHGVEESWGVPFAITISLIGIFVFFAGVSFKWMQMDSERKEYSSEIQGYESAYSNSAQSLDLLRHREFLLDKRPESQDRLDVLDLVLSSAAGIPSVKIHSIRVFDINDPDGQSVIQGVDGQLFDSGFEDFNIEFSVPQDDGISARDQVEPIVALLNHKTGMTIRVIEHVSESSGPADSPIRKWRYRVGGGRNAI